MLGIGFVLHPVASLTGASLTVAEPTPPLCAMFPWCFAFAGDPGGDGMMLQEQQQWCGLPLGQPAFLPQVVTASNETVKIKVKKKSKHVKKKQIEKQAKTKLKTKDKKHVCDVQINPDMMAKFANAKAMLLSDGDLHRVPFVWEPWRGEAAEVLAAVTKFLVLDADHHGQATLLWPALLLSAFPEFRHTSNTRLDLMLVSLVMLCRRNRSSGLAVHDFIEYSAGSCELTMQCLLKDLVGVPLDKCLKVEHDNATANGLRLWIMELTKTKPGALTWFGTQCSSFTSLCLHQSQRRPNNLWLGDMSKNFVRYGNNQMVITALLMALSYWIGNVAILEQPLTSTMPRCQPLRSVFEFVKVTRVVTWHGAFGAKSKKPLQILSSHSMIECLKRPKPSGKSSTLAHPGEAGTFTGKKQSLLQSQAYTPLFGKAVAEMILASRL